MGKFKLLSAGKTVDLKDTDFKAQGGEGSIYIIGDVVYKVCDAGKMIPANKMKELAVLDHPNIIKPEDILLNSKNVQVGYTMKKVPGNAVTLAQILSKTYRERENVTPDMMASLVKQIVDGIYFIHKHPGYLQVDGNELNYMVSDHKDVYFIDVNSYQTPNYPADAIMPSIRDWSAGSNFTHLTDWYSCGIITWYMFTGIHPFKGRHPNFKNLKTAMIDRMLAGVSILDKDADFPKTAVYYPFDQAIPGGANGAYMQWYKALFIENKRLPAPDSFQSKINFIPTVKEIFGSNNFDIIEIRDCMGQITGYLEKNGREVIITTEKIYVDNQPFPKTTNRFRVGFTENGTPVALIFDGSHAKVLKIETQDYLQFETSCKDIMSYNGRLFFHSGQYIYELMFIGNTVVPKMVATVMPEATQLFNGVAFQDMFGSKMMSVFPEPNHHRQMKIDELKGVVIIDAKFDNKVLMVLGMDRGEGQSTRFVFRFSDDYLSYDVRKIENIVATGINFTVLDSGITICINEEEKVEIFMNQKDNNGIKVVSDPAINSNMRLCKVGKQARLANGTKLHSFSIKKTK